MTEPASEVSLRAALEQGLSVGIYAPLVVDDVLDCKLHGIEHGGVWIENQQLTDMMLKELNQSAFESTPVFFLPYSSIRVAYVMLDLPSFSSEKMGLQTSE